MDDFFGADSSGSDTEGDINRFIEEDGEEENDEETESEKQKITNLNARLTPEELFEKFDADLSGYISVDEFLTMLPEIGIHVVRAKGLRLFQKCDTDGGGEIDLHEFKMALYACDPNGNTQGFSISNILGPKDAFELFDEDKSGHIDEDEFAEILEYMKIDIEDSRLETIFAQYDTDNSQSIEYGEFRSMWVEVCDAKKELKTRQVEIPEKATPKQLQALLQYALEIEEEKERRAVEEAKWWHAWQVELDRRTNLGIRALSRAKDELAAALDAAGQVYMIGKGHHDQFDHPPAARDAKKHEGYKIVQDMWKSRVSATYIPPRVIGIKAQHQKNFEEELENGKPEVPVFVPVIEVKKQRPGMVRRRVQNYRDLRLKKFAPIKIIRKEKEQVPEKDRLDSEMLTFEHRRKIKCLRFEPFSPLVCTSWLWGRRVIQGALSDNVAYALTDTGEIFTWGGASRNWDGMDELDEEDIVNVDTFTPRTQQLKMLTETQRLHNVRRIRDQAVEQRDVASREAVGQEDIDYYRLSRVCKYYNAYEEPPRNSNERMIFMQTNLLPKITREAVQFSMHIRGQETDGKITSELIDLAADVFELEVELRGGAVHEELKASEMGIVALRNEEKDVDLAELINEFKINWRPLSQERERRTTPQVNEEKRIVNFEMEIEKSESFLESIQRRRVQIEDPLPEYTKEGTSRRIEFSGITDRGPPLQASARGGAAAVWHIAAGGQHAALLTHEGRLYTWGSGSWGRLGHGYTRKGRSSCLDSDRPKVVQLLKGVSIKQVACSNGMTIALSTNGKLFSTGSILGCGVGHIDTGTFQYTAVPLPVRISASKVIRQVSCGASHAGCTTIQGAVYVWGNANGGRLGLGPSVRDCVSVPIVVKALRGLRASQISCGNAHSAICTEVASDTSGVMDYITGGEVFVCGNAVALGKFYTTWTSIEGLENIKQVSCGFSHTGAVSVYGECFLWGQNQNECSGKPPEIQFVPKPHLLEWLFQTPQNLALNQPTRQSSVYNMQASSRAVNGMRHKEIDKCTHTQYDDRPWWEVDLGQPVVVQRIRIWNCAEKPKDHSRAEDEFTKRLFPFYVFVSEIPFKDADGRVGFKLAKSHSSAVGTFLKNERLTEWVLPKAESVGQYIRIQIDRSSFLHLSQVEVFGVYDAYKTIGKVDAVECGHDITMVVMRPVTKAKTIKDYYIRAVRADADASKILRQFETYQHYFIEFDRGNDFLQRECILCRSYKECEICAFFRETPSDDLPLGPLEERLGLADIVEIVKNRKPMRPEWEDIDVVIPKPDFTKIGKKTKFPRSLNFKRTVENNDKVDLNEQIDLQE